MLSSVEWNNWNLNCVKNLNYLLSRIQPLGLQYRVVDCLGIATYCND